MSRIGDAGSFENHPNSFIIWLDIVAWLLRASWQMRKMSIQDRAGHTSADSDWQMHSFFWVLPDIFADSRLSVRSCAFRSRGFRLRLGAIPPFREQNMTVQHYHFHTSSSSRFHVLKSDSLIGPLHAFVCLAWMRHFAHVAASLYEALTCLIYGQQKASL